MTAYQQKVLEALNITPTHTLYIDFTNGNQANDGLTEATAKKYMPAPVSASGTAVILLCQGDHVISTSDRSFFTEGTTYSGYALLHSYYANKTNVTYIIGDPQCKLTVDISGNCCLIGCADDRRMNVIGLNAIVTGASANTGQNGGVVCWRNAVSYPNYISNCYIKLDPASNLGGNMAIYFGTTPIDLRYCIIDWGSALLRLYTNMGTNLTGHNLMLGGSLWSYEAYTDLTCYTNIPSSQHSTAYSERHITVTTDLSATYDETRFNVTINDEISDSVGVLFGAYGWKGYLLDFIAQIRDGYGDYYVFDESDQLIAAISADDALPNLLTQDMIAQINNLADPQLVFVVNDVGDFHAIKTDDKQLMIPTGDIDISLAASVLRFDFDDTGDVRRLVSVDSGDSWQYYDNGAWATYTGDITDKEALYAVANDTATLNALSEADIAPLIPPETLVKRIRFLTLLTQETLQSTTVTRSVSVESMRRGRYESVPAAQFTETVSFGNLAVKYIGTAALAELRLLISVSEGKR